MYNGGGRIDGEDGAVKATQCGSHLFQLTRPGISNCYLVREDDGPTLIDTSFSRSADGIMAATGRLTGTITRITITHAHHDHGQLAFLDTRDHTLIASEAYLSIGGLFVTTELVLRFPFPALAGT